MITCRNNVRLEITDDGELFEPLARKKLAELKALRRQNRYVPNNRLIVGDDAQIYIEDNDGRMPDVIRIKGGRRLAIFAYTPSTNSYTDFGRLEDNILYGGIGRGTPQSPLECWYLKADMRSLSMMVDATLTLKTGEQAAPICRSFYREFNEWWRSGTMIERMPGVYSYMPELRDVVAKLSKTLLDKNTREIRREDRFTPDGDLYTLIVYGFVDGPSLPWWVFVRKRNERYAIFDNSRLIYRRDENSFHFEPPFKDEPTEKCLGVAADETSPPKIDNQSDPTVEKGVSFEEGEIRSDFHTETSSQNIDPYDSVHGEASSSISSNSYLSESVTVSINGKIIGTYTAAPSQSGSYYHKVDKDGVLLPIPGVSDHIPYTWSKNVDEEGGERPKPPEATVVELNSGPGELVERRLSFNSAKSSVDSYWHQWVDGGGKEHFILRRNENHSWSNGALLIRYWIPPTSEPEEVKTYKAITIRRFVMRNGKVNRLITKLLVEDDNNFGTAIFQTQELAAETKAALYLTGKMQHYAALFAETENLNVDSQGSLTLEQQETLRIIIGRALMVGVKVARNDLLDDQDLPKLVALHWVTGLREFLVSDLPSI